MGQFNANLFYHSDSVSMIYTEDCWDSDFISTLNENVFVFFQFTWNVEDYIDSFPWNLEKRVSEINKRFPFKTNFIFCAPTEHVRELIEGKGYSSIFLNHNCLLNDEKFSIGEGHREFHAVINSRPFWWKRVYLASKVENLLYIKGNDWANNDTSWSGWKEMTNILQLKSTVSQSEVISSYKKSSVGLILSGNTGFNQQGKFEGANYSSSEYLLCGLPVVSTPSGGGRSVWFNSGNSIICEPEPDSVKEAVDEALAKLDSGYFCNESIRRNQVEKMKSHRQNLVQKVNELINGLSKQSTKKICFEDIYTEKMCNYSVNKVELIRTIKR